MRDYQLAGLQWLVDRWDDGVSTILGDEMVRWEACSMPIPS
jgi:SNF2 family DNA or RNA helicase